MLLEDLYLHVHTEKCLLKIHVLLLEYLAVTLYLLQTGLLFLPSSIVSIFTVVFSCMLQPDLWRWHKVSASACFKPLNVLWDQTGSMVVCAFSGLPPYESLCPKKNLYDGL
ncbi:hypothetical protein KC19_8G200400 [Ceratodon purpureus]|uniref:Uncharacterized protein n=1 Tax=Ceratodon purpureus TaxID=3225 RepID=A0A8T0H488_CERPU|nr:hypothetical protein KC19_8G200400 [Ceratodon purpureus]